MKSFLPHFRHAACISLFGIVLFPSVLYAQNISVDPDDWDTFVHSDQNILRKDTFLMQTFNEAACDVWSYSANEEVSVIDPKTTTLKNASVGMILKVPQKGNVTFTIHEAKMTAYAMGTVNVIAPFAVYKVVKGETLYLNAERQYASAINNMIVIQPKKDNVTFDFKTIKTGYEQSGKDLVIGSNPTLFNLQCGTATSASNDGFYAIDSVYAYGNIQEYSLFTGSGNWNDTIQWSHFPAARHRHALINGDVTINSNTDCNSLHVGNGSVNINNATITVNGNLLMNTNSALISNGEISIQKQLKVQYTAPHKGAWFFISFPFDVYKEGLDPDFRLQDDTFQGAGNYFYIQEYDGDRRAQTGESSGNWKVLPASVAQGDEPVFRKNKGYLLALDAAATRTTLTFASRPGDLPNDFAATGKISIPATAYSHTDNKHTGWYLCGNPMPAPMPLRQIQSNTDTDGFIYLYDGEKYTAYALDSNYALPPYSAFFVKAKKETELIVHAADPSDVYTILPVSAPLRSSKQTEPEIPITTQNQITENSRSPLFQLDNSTLWIKEMPSAGMLVITDISGRLMLQKPLVSGDNAIPISFLRGIYLFTIEFKGERIRFKHVIM